MGLSLSQYTCTHMAVKKCSEGYFVSNLVQEANLAWLYEHASLRQRPKPFRTLRQPVCNNRYGGEQTLRRIQVISHLSSYP